LLPLPWVTPMRTRLHERLPGAPGFHPVAGLRPLMANDLQKIRSSALDFPLGSAETCFTLQ